MGPDNPEGANFDDLYVIAPNALEMPTYEDLNDALAVATPAARRSGRSLMILRISCVAVAHVEPDGQTEILPTA